MHTTLRRRAVRRTVALVVATASYLHAPPVRAQGMSGQHDHAAMQRTPTSPRLTLPGQDAFGAIAEVVRLLEADSTTDWRTVDLERLRRHLVDMHEVTLNAAVAQRAVEGGVQMDVTGSARTRDAIRRMTSAHDAQLEAHGLVGAIDSLPRGVRYTVRAIRRDDARLAAKIRALGFIGILTLGDHHAAHHLAIARGASPHGH